MQPVEDDDGRRYVLRKASSDAWLVVDPESGEASYRDPEALTRVESAGPLATAAGGVPEAVRRLLVAVPDERALGLVIAVVDGGPVGVRDLLAETTLCESDLHGLLAELVAADLLSETRVAGERGYEATADAELAVARLRGEVDGESD